MIKHMRYEKDVKNSARSMRHGGFTIVELLIVIVVIAILAAITIVAYNGIQQRARDSDRQGDIATIAKAIELYYADNGTFPSSAGSTKINASWVTTADASWANLVSQLVPKYISAMPQDPLASTATNPGIYSGYNYDYILLTNGWCDTSSSKPGYLLAYRLESSAQKYAIHGDCPATSTQPTNYSSSEHIVIK